MESALLKYTHQICVNSEALFILENVFYCHVHHITSRTLQD